MKAKILIYGAGHFAQKFMTECFDNEKAEVLAFVESVISKNKFLNYDVITGKDINDYEYDLLLVISGYIEEIKRTLESYNIDRNKCVFTSDIHNWICNRISYRKLMKILNDRYIKLVSKKFALLKKPVNPSRFRTHPAVPELSALCIILAVFLKGGKNVSADSA